MIACKKCLSENIIKSGIKIMSKKKGEMNRLQQYKCKSCGHIFY